VYLHEETTQLGGEGAEVILVDWRLQLDDRQIFIGASVAASEEHLLAKRRTEWLLHQREALGDVRAWVDCEVRHGWRRTRRNWGFSLVEMAVEGGEM